MRHWAAVGLLTALRVLAGPPSGLGADNSHPTTGAVKLNPLLSAFVCHLSGIRENRATFLKKTLPIRIFFCA
jgi:hypothetical protein